MPERSIRFAVADLSRARRAATWKCWTPGNKRDVYVACREMHGAVKLSLHESGAWNIAFDRPERFEPDSVPKSRFAAQYQKPAELAPGVILACRIHTPHFAASVPMSGLENRLRYIAPAGPGESVEVAILLIERGHLGRGWPTCNSMPTAPVGFFEWDDGACVWAIAQRVQTMEPPPPLRGTPAYFRGATPEDLDVSVGLRMIGMGAHTDGSIVLTEMPVQVERRKASN
jgi:hypothetical protein